MKYFYYVFFFLLLTPFAVNGQQHLQRIDLSGEWQFQMDPQDRDDEEKWYETTLPETVRLPGSMEENGKGDDITLKTEWTGDIRDPEWYKDPNYAPYYLDPIGGIRFPFWLQPLKKYAGAAWYQKKVIVPNDWKEKSIRLVLERPHWESTVWVNGQLVGTQNSLATPHVFVVSPHLRVGENTLTIRIDNRIKDIDVGVNSHSITDHTQTNWNGIVGDISLNATGKIRFENVEIFPEINSKTIEIRATVNNALPKERIVTFTAYARLKKTGKKTERKSWEFRLTPGENRIKMEYSLDENALLWDEFNPNVYKLFLALKSDKETDEERIDFGLREFKVRGTRFAVNGRPVFLRGTLECAIFPKTGYPPTGHEYWEKIFRAIKAHGLNHVRFHSWCPPEAAFDVADEMGVYLQVECSSWANGSTQLGSGLPVDQYIWDESKRIVKAYGNHPSFVMMAYGNEPGGPHHSEFLTKFVTYWKETDRRRVYTSAAGWPVLKVNDYHNIPRPRIQSGGDPLENIINSEPPKTSFDWSDRLPGDGKPVVSHEIGQWCVYPNFKEMAKYTGLLKPKNFEIFRESLKAHHMEQLADSFLLASGKLQALCYKADIEAALRTPGFAGFQLLGLYDFPGQGTALVGVLDPFWEGKGYISPAEFSQFCNTTVPLARLEKRIFTEGEAMTADIEIAHFGEDSLVAVNPIWELVQNGKTIASGNLGLHDIHIGNAIPLGKIVYPFEKENKPRKLTLVIKVGDFENSWDIWVYPENSVISSKGVMIVENMNDSVLNYLENGGKVLLSLGKGKVSPEIGGNIGIGFSTVFWNTAWFPNQKLRSLGILCDPNHPAFGLFPTEYHSNWQWWDAVSHADAIQLDSFPVELHPIVRVIDDWVTNRRLALIFEAKVGKGSILVSGTDLVNDLFNRPEARQLKVSLLKYMESDRFKPSVQIEADKLKTIQK